MLPPLSLQVILLYVWNLTSSGTKRRGRQSVAERFVVGARHGSTSRCRSDAGVSNQNSSTHQRPDRHRKIDDGSSYSARSSSSEYVIVRDMFSTDWNDDGFDQKCGGSATGSTGPRCQTHRGKHRRTGSG